VGHTYHEKKKKKKRYILVIITPREYYSICIPREAYFHKTTPSEKFNSGGVTNSNLHLLDHSISVKYKLRFQNSTRCIANYLSL
jgi:hypothetical protein